MSIKTTLKVSAMGISFLLFSFLFIGSSNLYAANGSDDCDNEMIISGNAKKVTYNWGVQYAWKIKNAPDGYGAKFYDNGDKVVVKLDEIVKEGEKIFIKLKMRNYNSSYSGPIKCKVYESEDGYNWSYNKTIETTVKSYYVEKMFSVDGDTKYLKLVNGSSYHNGSPDFLVDGLSFEYSMCMDHCPDGPEPGTPCDDDNSNTTGDVINDDCDCEGTEVAGGTFTVCAQIDNSRDDAEEALTGDIGNVQTTSSDLELVIDEKDPAFEQIVGMRFHDLNIPQGATITSAFIQFTADESNFINPCELNIFGQNVDNAEAFSAVDYNISSRLADATTASVPWSPANWSNGDQGSDQQTPDISSVIQEIANRALFNENSAVVIMINGIGKRRAKSFDGSDSHAPILCVTYQTGCHDSDDDGVCDDDDQCEGFDDNVDVDNDGTPDGCDDCINEVHVEGDGKCVTSNWGVSYAYKILGAPDNKGAKFFDHGDKLVVKLDDCVEEGQKIIVTVKRRDYNSSYNGPIKLKVYESKHGYCWSYNKTIETTVKSYYVDKMFSVDGNTKYLKLVNGSSCYKGAPDFYVDAVRYDYTLCDDVDICPNGNPGAACDDGNPNTIDDIIGANCECAGTPLANYDVCSRVDSSSDDAEENPSGVVDLNSSDLELVYESNPGYSQTVGMRFNNMNIPAGAVINSATIQFTVKNATNIDPCELTIAGERSKDAATFSTATGNISSRDQTTAFEIWEPAAWVNTDDSGAAQQTVDISDIIQEIVDLDGNVSNSIAIIIVGNDGKRIAYSFDNTPGKAPELCISYSAPFQGGGSPQGMAINNSSNEGMLGETLGNAEDTDNPNIELTGDIVNINIEDAPETIMVAPNSINVFPIPASKDLNVDLVNHEGRPARISVFNQLGQLQEVIDVESIPASPVQLKVENYNNGAYYMNIEIENSKSITKKFIVNRSY